MGRAMTTSVRALGRLVRTAFNQWIADRAPTLGAALAFYSILSLAPLLMIAVAVAALAVGREAAEGQLVEQLRGLVGQQGAAAASSLLASAQHPAEGVAATIMGLVVLLVGASGVFAQLQEAMNVIWKVPPAAHAGVVGLIRDRFASFAMVLGTGFLLLISLVASAAIAGAGTYLRGWFPALEPYLHLANTLVTLLVVTLLFAAIFKVLPDAHVPWSCAFVGAAITAVLFTLGKTLIGLYLGKSGLASAYGAAGSFVVLVVWIYYSAQILYFGAELTHAYSQRLRQR